MSKRKARPARNDPRGVSPFKPSPAPSALAGALGAFESLGAWTRPACLLAASALLTVTPLIPSESAAAKGTALPLVMLWLALLAAWLLSVLSRERIGLRFGWTDAAVMLFLGWHSLSGVVMAGRGNPRQTLNMLWTWIGFGAAFFVLRQLVRSAAEGRALCAVMISLAVGLSGLGLFQFAYEAPLQRRQYDCKSKEEQTEAIRRETGLYAPEGSRQRELFESRLRSSEPLATFALTNSLAGYLAPWLMVLLGMVVMEWRGGRLNFQTATERAPHGRARIVSQYKTIAALVLAALLIGACLLLTKSRTAWLACAGGVPLLLFLCRGQGGWPKWLVPALGGAALVAVLLAVGAVAAGGLDWEVLSSAPKSVLYRIEYWRSTAMMIAEHPWFGCGPGNFQEYYTTYKLPQANETIADPHNFILEVWATAGTPAVVALAAVLGTFAWAKWSRLGAKCVNQPAETESRPNGETPVPSHPRAILLGGTAGLLLALPLCTLAGFPLTNLQVPEVLRGWPLAAWLQSVPTLWITAFPLALVTGYLLWPWVQSGEGAAYSPVFATAIVVLLVNLLAAGGIGYPGVANSLWLLMVLALATGAAEVSISRVIGGGLLLLVMGLVLTCQTTAYAPVLTAAVEMERGKRLEAEQQMPAAATAYAAAAKADIFSPEPWEQLARLALSKWLFQPNDRNLSALDAAIDGLIRLDPRSSDVRMHAGDWYLLAFRHRPDPPLIERAVRAYEASVERYPSSGLAHARLAWAHALAGDKAAAQREAAEALRLDGLTPHEDMKLSRQPIFDPGPAESPLAGVPDKPRETNAEELMRRLTKA